MIFKFNFRRVSVSEIVFQYKIYESFKAKNLYITNTKKQKMEIHSIKLNDIKQ